METLNQLNFANCAEDVIENKIGRNKRNQIEITTSKMRNMLELTNTLYNKLIKFKDNELSEEILGYIQYLRMKFAYESGRDKKVNNFVEKAQLMRHINDIGKSKSQALLFCRYMEALVAFHKFYGGRDK